MKVFVINLERSADRREVIEPELQQQGLDYEFFKAVDGSKLADPQSYADEHGCMVRVKRLMTHGEIGCCLSHYQLWQRVVEEELPWACIMEDDLILEPHLAESLSQTQALSPDNIYYLHRYHYCF